MNIIAISGNNNVGKTTVAKIIQYYLSNYLKEIGTIENYLKDNDIYNNDLDNVVIMSFADKVVESYNYYHKIDFHKLNREDKEKERPYFIKFAENVKNKLGKSYWALILIRKIISLLLTTSIETVIIPDLRFEEEYNHLEQFFSNIKFIKIIKDEKENEALKDKYFDAVIKNDYSIKTLIDTVELILKSFKNE